MDNLNSSRLLYLSSAGLAATKRSYAVDPLELVRASDFIDGSFGEEEEEAGHGEDG